MFFIKLGQGLRVKKDRGRAFKSDTMFFHVLSGFDWVPLELILERFLHIIISQPQLMARRAQRGLPTSR